MSDAEFGPVIKAVGIKPNSLSIEEIDQQLGNGGLLQTHASDPAHGLPHLRPELWKLDRVVNFRDYCLKYGSGEYVKRSYKRWVFHERTCSFLREVWEFDDMPNFYFPPLSAPGFVQMKDRKNKGLYRLYTTPTGHSSSWPKIPTNRCATHTIPASGKHASTNFVCPICAIICLVKNEPVVAALSLIGVPNMICGGCQSVIVEVDKRQGQHICILCGDFNAAYPEFADGTGRKQCLHANCFRKLHGVDPPRLLLKSVCTCGARPPNTQIHRCAVCVLLNPGFTLDRLVCNHQLESGLPCNIQMSPAQADKCELQFPGEHPVCPHHFREKVGLEAARKRREHAWVALVRSKLPLYFTDANFDLQLQVIVGNDDACRSSELQAQRAAGKRSRNAAGASRADGKKRMVAPPAPAPASAPAAAPGEAGPSGASSSAAPEPAPVAAGAAGPSNAPPPAPAAPPQPFEAATYRIIDSCFSLPPVRVTIICNAALKVCAIFVQELDEGGHIDRKCYHNKNWTAQVCDALWRKYGWYVNIFLVRIDPDGKKSDGSKPTLDECAEVTVGCLRAQHAKAAALSEERAALVEAGKVPVGRCFISRRFFVPDNLQLINENALCEEDFRFVNEDS